MENPEPYGLDWVISRAGLDKDLVFGVEVVDSPAAVALRGAGGVEGVGHVFVIYPRGGAAVWVGDPGRAIIFIDAVGVLVGVWVWVCIAEDCGDQE